jgi:hypothetical protein
MMAVTTPGSAIDPKDDELNGAEKNNLNSTSPLEGEVDAAQQRREGGKPQTPEPIAYQTQTPAPGATPLPGPPPQGGREQTGACGKRMRVD